MQGIRLIRVTVTLPGRYTARANSSVCHTRHTCAHFAPSLRGIPPPWLAAAAARRGARVPSKLAARPLDWRWHWHPHHLAPSAPAPQCVRRGGERAEHGQRGRGGEEEGRRRGEGAAGWSAGSAGGGRCPHSAAPRTNGRRGQGCAAGRAAASTRGEPAQRTDSTRQPHTRPSVPTTPHRRRPGAGAAPRRGGGHLRTSLSNAVGAWWRVGGWADCCPTTRARVREVGGPARA